MAILFLESGTDATQGIEFFTSSSGTVASSTTTSVTGPRAVRCTSGGAGAAAWVQRTGIIADSGGRLSLRVRVSAIPTANQPVATVFNVALSSSVFFLRLISSGVLELAAVGAGTTPDLGTLSVNTWYRLSIAWVLTATNNYTIKAWLDGANEVTITQADGNLTGLIGGSGPLRMGWTNAGVGNSVTTDIEDIYVDDSTALTDPGDVHVTYKAPTTTNANNFDTTGGTGAVNERPISTTNYKQHAAISSATQNYAIQDAATGDCHIAGLTLLGYGAWIWAKGTAGGAGTPKITNNGADTAIVLTASAALYTNYVASSSYPSNAATVGMVATNNADDTFLYECGMLIAYTTERSDNLLPLLGVG
jgi:hypothetical protein